MGETKKALGLSEKHKQEIEATANALQIAPEKRTAETKKQGRYLVVSDEHRNTKRSPSKNSERP